ncbi:Protein kinase-like domain [Pseudocohnilembus persalinus]|uniref:Protein kinase-like domain n=1 Tax=Pseudocohnilembus persalinus TaxID=266149 RepID=A0A0V0Q8R6_PSEPJ|nr:Protein kinase-like domain [Pseudocohnilembus persalinus]|eukprot:KRW98590.1 Protein kinase-like domain [Pseudocohnilembus persalinus]
MADSGERVAIKKVFQDKRYKNRELQIIKELKHYNIVNLKNAFYRQGENNKDEVYLMLVMEFVPDTLSRVIRAYRKQKVQMDHILIKCYAYQMFRGLLYLQSVGVCHRDIKPQNILVDEEKKTLKICDFGSAKKLIKGEPNVAYICSRYYRAPELIFGAQEYTTAIDVWSMGCVLAEMILTEPLFPGESAVDQLVEIIKILGTPTIEQVKEMNPKHTDFQFPIIKAHPWKKVFNNFKIDPQLLNLISKLLVYSPLKRLTPIQILADPYFDELRTQQFKQQFPDAPDFFDWSSDELKVDSNILINQLTPSWYKKNQLTQQQQYQQQNSQQYQNSNISYSQQEQLIQQ